MITVKFFKSSDFITGFEIYGHSGYAEEGSDILCASVSSAAYLTANTITEILKKTAKIIEKNGEDPLFSLRLEGDYAASQTVLMGLELHLKQLSDQNPAFIKIKGCNKC